ncbi:MAG: NRDE family protein [Thermodesulfobacteriota bacterium]
MPPDILICMCLILFAYRIHPAYDLIVAANRDEYYDRPSAGPCFWEEAPHLLAGRDLLAGGTWLGVTKKARFGAVTNYRDPASIKKNAPSRGNLVSGFLLGQEAPFRYLEGLHKEADRYNGFNLVLGDREELCWYSNRDGRVLGLPPGIYGISNHLLDTPWPKVVKGKEMLEKALRKPEPPSPDKLFEILRDRTLFPDSMLPSTGVDLEWERILSPLFIRSPVYGTRSSTLLFIGRDRRIHLLDRTFGPEHGLLDPRRFEFTIEA